MAESGHRLIGRIIWLVELATSGLSTEAKQHDGHCVMILDVYSSLILPPFVESLVGLFLFVHRLEWGFKVLRCENPY